jgi:UDP-N-acetylglucosamine:LPS N-acetylglucosamine transferase
MDAHHALAGTADGPVLLVTASMGDGHTQVARELASRLSGRMPTEVVDLLDSLPLRIGSALREGYAAMLRATPWLYEAIFQAFFVPRARWQPSTSPLAGLAARELHRVVTRTRARAVVATFHLAGQAAGLLRRTGRLHVPSVVLVTDAVSHALWNDPGTDLFLCQYPWVARQVRLATGRPALAPGPLTRPGFGEHADPARCAAVRAELGVPAGEHLALVAAGSWGTGDVLRTVRRLAGAPAARVVVLCGRNEGLRLRLADEPGCLALGWRDDLPALFRTASVLVDNAAGVTCTEAFAAGLPVVAHRPIPGHGRAGVRALVAAGLVADGERALCRTVAELCAAGPRREWQRERAAELFRVDPADALTDWLARTGRAVGLPAAATSG